MELELTETGIDERRVVELLLATHHVLFEE